MQLSHYNTTFKKQQFPIVIVCDNVSNALNIGSLFRTADTFGVEKIIFCGNAIPLGRKMTKTSRATEKYVKYERFHDVIETISKLKVDGYKTIALEITDKSKSIHSLNFLKNQPIALIIGDENFGISDQVLKLSDTVTHIDMFGQNTSMNVVQASTIALYEITKQIR